MKITTVKYYSMVKFSGLYQVAYQVPVYVNGLLGLDVNGELLAIEDDIIIFFEDYNQKDLEIKVSQ